jgi:putative sigma-54 modulation protein
MRLVLTGRNVEITPALRQLVEKKINKLERLLNDSVVSAQVVLTLEKYRHVAEIVVHARGDNTLHGLGDQSTWHLSLRQAAEKITQQASKVKDKWEKRKRRAGGTKALAVATPAGAPPAEGGATSAAPPARARAPRLATGSKVLRTSRYSIRLLTVDAAALQVDKSGENALVFRNAATNALSVLYRRRDGNLGLIEPEA